MVRPTLIRRYHLFNYERNFQPEILADLILNEGSFENVVVKLNGNILIVDLFSFLYPIDILII